MKTKKVRLFIYGAALMILLSGCDREAVSADRGNDAVTIETVQDSPSAELAEVQVTTLSAKEQQAESLQLPAQNAYTDLRVPTYITKIDDLYFIVDCYHDQVIYNDNLTDPLSDWAVLSDHLSKPHTIASDGCVYLVDDTENHCVQVYEKTESGFIHTETIENTGNRPHYIQYDTETKTFYVWSSQSGEMFLIKRDRDGNHMYLSERLQIAELKDSYVRSFTLEGDEVWFVSGNGNIIQSRKDDLTILKSYPVPADMAGMIQLTVIDGMYYLTISTNAEGNQDYATIIRTKDLDGLMSGEYEDIYNLFVGGGTPYYISQIDGTYFMTEHRLPEHSVWSFEVKNGEIENIQTVY